MSERRSEHGISETERVYKTEGEEAMTRQVLANVDGLGRQVPGRQAQVKGLSQWHVLLLPLVKTGSISFLQHAFEWYNKVHL